MTNSLSYADCIEKAVSMLKTKMPSVLHDRIEFESITDLVQFSSRGERRSINIYFRSIEVGVDELSSGTYADQNEISNGYVLWPNDWPFSEDIEFHVSLRTYYKLTWEDRQLLRLTGKLKSEIVEERREWIECGIG